MFELKGYETLGEIGEGGMAKVWQARHLTLDRHVAVKVLTQDFSQDVEFLDRFRQEAQAAAKINHPNVVAVFDAGEANGVPYYVMEYAPGDTVWDIVESSGPMEEEASLRTMLEMARAMKHVWDQHRIIHCDIKPENLIIDDEQKVKILDLGLARILDAARDESEELADETLGTPNFMAPEQAMGREDLDPRADIYSAGATLYQMVTGRLPFEGLDPHSVLDSQVHGFLDDPITLRPELGMATAWLIEKMMVKDRDARTADWDAVITDIRCALGGYMIDSAPPKEGESTVLRSPARKTPKRKRMVVSKQSLHAAAGEDGEHTLHHAGHEITRNLMVLVGLLVLVVMLYFYTFVGKGPPGP